MRVLITGGSGFIGAWIIRRLVHDGIAVRVFDIQPDRRIVRRVAGANLADGWTGGSAISATVRRSATPPLAAMPSSTWPAS